MSWTLVCEMFCLNPYTCTLIVVVVFVVDDPYEHTKRYELEVRFSRDSPDTWDRTRFTECLAKLRYESPVPIRQSIIINSISRANKWVRRKPLNRPARSLDALEPTQTRSPLYPHNRTTTPMLIGFSLISTTIALTVRIYRNIRLLSSIRLGTPCSVRAIGLLFKTVVFKLGAAAN